MADDDPAINSGLNLSFINLYMKLFNYREQCQDLLARLTMLPPDYSRYIQLRSYFLFGFLSYTEFSSQMYEDLLLQNPNYAHLCVYWADFHRFFIEGIQMVDCPLLTFPIMLYSNMGLPIAPADIAQFEDLASELWNQVPAQNRILVVQQVRNWQSAYHQELDRQEEQARQQEMVEEEQRIRTRYRASEATRLANNREDRKRRAKKKKRTSKRKRTGTMKALL